MTDVVSKDQVSAGTQVTGTVIESGKTPQKKDAIVGLASVITMGAIKWFEIHTGYNVPALGEVLLTTIAISLASYFTPERFTAGWRPTFKDVVAGVSGAFAAGVIKTYEVSTGIDIPAEYEIIIIPAFVGFCTSMVSGKGVEITNVNLNQARPSNLYKP